MKDVPVEVDLANLWLRVGVSVAEGTVVFQADASYWFTGLNPNKDGPPGDIQKKSWTITQIRCRILFVFQGPQSAAAYSRTHVGVGSYPAGARPSPETDRAVRGGEAAPTGEG